MAVGEEAYPFAYPLPVFRLGDSAGHPAAFTQIGGTASQHTRPTLFTQTAGAVSRALIVSHAKMCVPPPLDGRALKGSVCSCPPPTYRSIAALTPSRNTQPAAPIAYSQVPRGCRALHTLATRMSC